VQDEFYKKLQRRYDLNDAYNNLPEKLQTLEDKYNELEMLVKGKKVVVESV